MTNEKSANLNVTLKDLFFRWIDITQGFHKLNRQQRNALSLFLYYHFMYKKEITNNKVLWKIVFDYDTKQKICSDPVFKKKELSTSNLANIMTHLRKKNIIIDNEISKLYIPDISRDCKSFKVVFNFNIVDNE